MNTVLKRLTPEVKVFTYRLNPETGYYEQLTGELGFFKLPFDLKVEQTRKPDQINSKLICRGRVKAGKYLFFTGLIPIYKDGVFFGDHYEFVKGEKKNSFVLFEFSEGNNVMTVHFFNHFKVYPKRRLKFVSDYFNK